MLSVAKEISKTILILLIIFIFPLFFRANEIETSYMYCHHLNLSLSQKNEFCHFVNYKCLKFFLKLK